MTPAPPSLRLALSNRPGCLEIVRGALDGLADATGLDALARNDLATAVGEACKNVILHAYEGLEGPLELELAAPGDRVEAVVRDRGIGIRPHLGERTRPHNGIGMPIVHLLCRRVTYTNMPAGGTELRMEVETPGASALSPLPAQEDLGAPARPAALALATVPGPLACAVLPRLLDALIVREHESAGLRRALQSCLGEVASLATEDRELRLLLCPLDGGLAIELGPLGPALARALSAGSPALGPSLDGPAEPGAVVKLGLSG